MLGRSEPRLSLLLIQKHLIVCNAYYAWYMRGTSMCGFYPLASHGCSFHLDKCPSHNPCMPLNMVALVPCLLTGAHQMCGSQPMISFKGRLVSVSCALCKYSMLLLLLSGYFYSFYQIRHRYLSSLLLQNPSTIPACSLEWTLTIVC